MYSESEESLIRKQKEGFAHSPEITETRKKISIAGRICEAMSGCCKALSGCCESDSEDEYLDEFERLDDPNYYVDRRSDKEKKLQKVKKGLEDEIYKATWKAAFSEDSRSLIEPLNVPALDRRAAQSYVGTSPTEEYLEHSKKKLDIARAGHGNWVIGRKDIKYVYDSFDEAEYDESVKESRSSYEPPTIKPKGDDDLLQHINSTSNIVRPKFLETDSPIATRLGHIRLPSTITEASEGGDMSDDESGLSLRPKSTPPNHHKHSSYESFPRGGDFISP